jgi:hypothetical protein
MNIFVLDLNHTICAQYHNDKHVVKNKDAVKAYSDYYIKYNNHIATLKNREKPEWWKGV